MAKLNAVFQWDTLDNHLELRVRSSVLPVRDWGWLTLVQVGLLRTREGPCEMLCWQESLCHFLSGHCCSGVRGEKHFYVNIKNQPPIYT